MTALCQNGDGCTCKKLSALMLRSRILSSLNTNSARVLLHWLLLLAAQQPHACELLSMLVRASWLALDALGSRPTLTFFSSSSTVGSIA